MVEEAPKSPEAESWTDEHSSSPAKAAYRHIPEDRGLYGVHVGGFTAEVSESFLRDLFTGVGNVQVCKVICPKNQAGVPEEKRTYVAFVKFKLKEEALRAIDNLDGFQTHNCTLCVRPAYQSQKASQLSRKEEKDGRMPGEQCTRAENSASSEFLSAEGQLSSPSSESVCSATNDGGGSSICQKTGGSELTSDQGLVLSNSKETGDHQQPQENGCAGNLQEKALPPVTGSDNPVSSADGSGRLNGKCQEGGSKSSGSMHSSGAQKTTDEKGQEVGNEQGQDLSGHTVSSHQHNKKPGRHPNWRQDLPGYKNTKHVGKDFSKPHTNSSQEFVKPKPRHHASSGEQSMTDYRLREGLLDQKHVVNFNTGKEKPRPDSSVTGFQRGQTQMGSPHARTQQNPIPPVTTTAGLLYGNPNTQTWLQQQAGDYSGSSYNHSQAQGVVTEPYPNYQTDIPPWSRGQGDPSFNASPHRLCPASQYSTPASFTAYPQASSGSTSGLNYGTVSSINPAMSQLTFPAATPPRSPMQFSKDLSLWSPQDIADYVRGTECAGQANFFVEQDIDGKALLLLETGVLLHFMKAGPALKLLQVIERLRKSATAGQTTR